MMQCSFYSLLFKALLKRKKKMCTLEMFLVNLFERWISLPCFYVIHCCVCFKKCLQSFQLVCPKKRKEKRRGKKYKTKEGEMNL